jgi:outer membrane protein OmpA-like peptidoglycan-associated protein
MWLWIWLLLFLIMYCIWNKLQTFKTEQAKNITTPVIINDQQKENTQPNNLVKVEKDISLKIVKDGPVVRVSGVFPSEEKLQEVLQALQSAGDSVERGAVIIDPKADNPKLFAAIPAIAKELSHFQKGVIEYHQKRISVDGITENPLDKTTISDVLLAIDKSYSVQNQIIVEEPEPVKTPEKSKEQAQQENRQNIQKQSSTSSASKAEADKAAEQKAQGQTKKRDLQQKLDSALAGKRVEFLYAKNILTPKSKKILDQVAEILKKYPNIPIEIGGHTDSDGTKARNLKLSQRRAEAVKAYLIKKGIAPNHLIAKGYGESRPLVKNDTPAHKQRNRRVEFKVIK